MRAGAPFLKTPEPCFGGRLSDGATFPVDVCDERKFMARFDESTVPNRNADAANKKPYDEKRGAGARKLSVGDIVMLSKN